MFHFRISNQRPVSLYVVVRRRDRRWLFHLVLTKRRGVTDLTSAPSQVTIHFTSTAIYCSLLTGGTGMHQHIVPDPADVSVDSIRQQHDCLFH